MLIVLDSSIGSARYFSAGFCSYIPPFLPVMALFPAVSLLKLKRIKSTPTLDTFGSGQLRCPVVEPHSAGAAASHPLAPPNPQAVSGLTASV